MAEDKPQEEEPLSSEALKRDEWRGGATVVREEDASGHTIPASESDPGSEDGQKGSGAVAGTIRPPD
jgi:hypothetical protein